MSSRHNSKDQIVSPGPCYLPQVPGRTSPSYTMRTRHASDKDLPTPGPSAYRPEDTIKSVASSSPAYSLRWRTSSQKSLSTPAPGSYTLPALTGHRSPDKTNVPAFTMSTKSAGDSALAPRSSSPGPAQYSAGPAVESSTFTTRSPAYTMAGRHSLDARRTAPGPADYANSVSAFSPVPRGTFGVRHSRYSISPMV